MTDKFDIEKTEYSTLNGLKDFQRATVERIDYLFRSGQRRVLIADEVGMGKTLIARGTIVKTARLRMEEQDDLFKVVYICSNQNIANQNIRKLNVTGGNAIGNVADTRLSMQHLRIMEQENDATIKDGFIQLIPLTPETSFRMTSGGGSVSERALMFAILKRMSFLRYKTSDLEQLMILDGPKAWEQWAKNGFEWRVIESQRNSNKKYPANVIEKIENYEGFEEIKEMLLQHLKERKKGKIFQTYSDNYVINRLRAMFARVSVSMLEPDLVIMDEFQRFKFLLASENESEIGILANSFLNSGDTRVLLLSATPYKLYSTLEEIDENQIDEHYSEFYQVMDFLFKGKDTKFRRVWKDYSVALNEVQKNDSAILNIKKNAEDAMYGGVCRTERISVMDSGDYTDASSVQEHLEINENDILSYIQMGSLLKSIDVNMSLPADYVKSCPYLMSFMRNYMLKERIEKYFKKHLDEIDVANKPLLWVNRNRINNYEELPKTNARLEMLKEKAFEHGAEKHLWIPPSRPYYELQGVYKNSQGCSKILVFSAWEMVPRMLGSLISYEAERRTIGKLTKQEKNLDKKNAHYFVAGSKRYPVSRLRFNVMEGVAKGMNLFCLLYPSESLSNMYSPMETMNAKMSLVQIESGIRKNLKEKLDKLQHEYALPLQKKLDERWYYMAPMLMDGVDYVNDWMQIVTQEMRYSDEDDTTTERGTKGFLTHIEKLQEIVDSIKNLDLGKQPDDLLDTLVNMVLGSPAICIHRSNGHQVQRATALAKVFVNNFNLTESTAIVDLAYGRCKDDNSHWQNVLKYCKDGCFQAMFDEYFHMLFDAVGFSENADKMELIHGMMMDSLKIHTATYTIDTFQTFKSRMSNEKVKNVGIRSSYAVGFTKDAGDNAKIVNRKESVRNAFNSPLRPFVLATTSIGQEGLDFHNYCRKIIHWNLPSNPIDLEQREGRINRFKCLAIRQNVAEKYGDITFKENIWEEMFQTAAESEKQESQSELVPYWCFGKNQKIKIERIVPMYPMSKDEVNYERLIKILSLYRLTLGQARQEELLEYLFTQFDDTNELKNLFIDLSPFSKEKEG